MRFRIYFAFFEALLIEKELLIAKGHLVGTGLEENLGDTSLYTAGLQTDRYSVQLSVVPIYICLKEEADEASNSTLPLYSWAEERSLSSCMLSIGC